MGTQTHKLDCHQAACRVFRVVQEAVDQLSCFRIRITQHLFDQIGRCFLQKVDRIIQEHFIYDVTHFSVCDRLYDMFLCVIIHIREYFRRHIFCQQSENKQLLFCSQFLKIFRNIGRLFFIQFLFQLYILAAFHQRCIVFKQDLHFFIHHIFHPVPNKKSTGFFDKKVISNCRAVYPKKGHKDVESAQKYRKRLSQKHGIIHIRKSSVTLRF